MPSSEASGMDQGAIQSSSGLRGIAAVIAILAGRAILSRNAGTPARPSTTLGMRHP